PTPTSPSPVPLDANCPYRRGTVLYASNPDKQPASTTRKPSPAQVLSPPKTSPRLTALPSLPGRFSPTPATLCACSTRPQATALSSPTVTFSTADSCPQKMPQSSTSLNGDWAGPPWPIFAAETP